MTRSVTLADRSSLTYQQTSADQQGRWRLTKTYITDPARPTVLVDVSFERLKPGAMQLFALYDPSLAGDSGNDSGTSSGPSLTASDTHDAKTPIGSALVSSAPFVATSTGYVGTSDGATTLRTNHTLTPTYASAGPGNIAQAGQVPLDAKATSFTLALGFGANSAAALGTANASLRLPFSSQQALYQNGWKSYLSKLNKAPKGLDDKLTTQYWASVMTVKAHEDKTYPGAFIASLTIPWGQAVNASGAGGGGNGYHFVWARDEYQQVTALLAAGDLRRRAARRHLAVHPAAAGGRALPAELARRRHPGPDQRPARRDRVPDHPGLAGRAASTTRSTPTTSPRRPTTSSPAGRRPRRSAGRRPAATRPPRSPT